MNHRKHVIKNFLVSTFLIIVSGTVCYASTVDKQSEQAKPLTPEAVVKSFLIELQKKNYDHIKPLILKKRMVGNDDPDDLSGLRSNYGLSYIVSLLPKLDDSNLTTEELFRITGKGELMMAYDVNLETVYYHSPNVVKHKGLQFTEGSYITVRPIGNVKASWNKLPKTLQQALVFPVVKDSDHKWYIDIECMNVMLMGISQYELTNRECKLGIANTNYVPRYPLRYYKRYARPMDKMLGF